LQARTQTAEGAIEVIETETAEGFYFRARLSMRPPKILEIQCMLHIEDSHPEKRKAHFPREAASKVIPRGDPILVWDWVSVAARWHPR
jgi:hypothetical protein